MTITELRNKRKTLVETMDGFLEAKKDKNGVLSAEDDATYRSMETQFDELTKEIQRMERRAEIENEMNKPVGTPIIEKPMNGDSGEKKTGRASAEYKAAVLKAIRSNFRQISNVLSEGIDENGGYLVPEEYDKRLIDGLTEENVIRKLATVITTSGEHKINIAGTKPAAAWIEEGEALTFGDATFDQIILDAHKLHVAVKVTEELLYDNAFNLEISTLLRVPPLNCSQKCVIMKCQSGKYKRRMGLQKWENTSPRKKRCASKALIHFNGW